MTYHNLKTRRERLGLILLILATVALGTILCLAMASTAGGQVIVRRGPLGAQRVMVGPYGTGGAAITVGRQGPFCGSNITVGNQGGCTGPYCRAPRPTQPMPTPPASGMTPMRAPASIVRVIRRAADGMYLGTGTCLSGRHVVTCSHILGEGSLFVRFADGREQPATCIAQDASADIAILRVASSPGAVCRLAGQSPAVGGRADWCGWDGGHFACGTGVIASYSERAIFVFGQCRDGDSGGPIYDRSGIVGVITGNTTDGRQVAGASLVAIRRLVLSLPDGSTPQPEPTPTPAPAPKPDAPPQPTPADTGQLQDVVDALARIENRIDQLPTKADYADLTRRVADLEASKITVVFEGGDSDEEPERLVEVPLGGQLRIPPQRLTVRNVNTAGEQTGETETIAPLGLPLRIVDRDRSVTQSGGGGD